VTAIDYCQLLTLSRQDFHTFLTRHPDLRERMGEVAKTREEMNRQTEAVSH
jgi:CPA2 family monovalent cation:H+ antiporter-2